MIIVIAFLVWVFFATLVISFFMGVSALEDMQERSVRVRTVLDNPSQD